MPSADALAALAAHEWPVVCRVADRELRPLASRLDGGRNGTAP